MAVVTDPFASRAQHPAWSVLLASVLAAACASEAEPSTLASASAPPSDTTSSAAETASAIAPASQSAAAPTPPTSAMVAGQWLPTSEKPWTAAEYQTLARALGSVKSDDYPRKGDPVFSRMVARENYAFLASKELPMAERLPPGLDLVGALNQVNKLYIAALAKGVLLHRENLELQAMAACMTSAFVPVTREFVASLDKKDPKYGVRMQGLEGVKAGLNEVTVGALISISVAGFTEADRRWFAAAALPCLPPIVGFIKQKDRAARLEQAKAAAAKERDPLVRALLEDFLSATK